LLKKCIMRLFRPACFCRNNVSGPVPCDYTPRTNTLARHECPISIEHNGVLPSGVSHLFSTPDHFFFSLSKH
jgi:hypothetical protein